MFIIAGPDRSSNLTVIPITVALIATVALLAMIVVVLFIMIVKVHHHKSHDHPVANNVNSEEEVTVDMKQCAAYEMTSLARRKIKMETNPAYEQVRHIHRE